MVMWYIKLFTMTALITVTRCALDKTISLWDYKIAHDGFNRTAGVNSDVS
jgi:hypothetical protein